MNGEAKIAPPLGLDQLAKGQRVRVTCAGKDLGTGTVRYLAPRANAHRFVTVELAGCSRLILDADHLLRENGCCALRAASE